MAEQQPAEAFRSWGLLELFGHTRIAGELSEQSIGGCNFIRIDVPKVGNTEPYTRYFTQGAIYSMTPMAEVTARQLANYLEAKPVNSYELRATPSSPLLSSDSRPEDYEF